jgi:hypothetical protein
MSWKIFAIAEKNVFLFAMYVLFCPLCIIIFLLGTLAIHLIRTLQGNFQKEKTVSFIEICNDLLDFLDMYRAVLYKN